MTSPLSTTFSRAAVGEVMISLWWLVMGHKEMEWSVSVEVQTEFLVSSSLSGWLVTEIGSWSWNQDCQSRRSIWMLLLVTWFSFRKSCEEQGFGLDLPSGSLPTWDILSLKTKRTKIKESFETSQLMLLLFGTQYFFSLYLHHSHCTFPTRSPTSYPQQGMNGSL